MTKLLFDTTDVANAAQAGWTKFRLYDRYFYNADRSRGVKELVQKLALSHTVGPMIWNIEIWSLPQHEKQLIEIIDWTREVRPDIRQGFYALIPKTNFWGPVQHKLGLVPNSYDSWLQVNARLARGRGDDGRFVSRGLVDAVDFVCPSIYTFYNATDGGAYNLEELWHEFARITIEQARKYQKQVYPFLWPHLHPSSHPDMPAMSEAAFRLQLETTLKNADGVCVWDDGSLKPKFDCIPLMQEFATRNSAGEF